MNTERTSELSYQKTLEKYDRLSTQKDEANASITWNLAKGSVAAGLGVLLFVSASYAQIDRSLYASPQPVRLRTLKILPPSTREKLEYGTGAFLGVIAIESIAQVALKAKEAKGLQRKFQPVEQAVLKKIREDDESTEEKTPKAV
ncbi:MAG TPA: hypothetical protein VJ179_01945 [Patescibacteria group bacterium]|nr:hypothetical protein [Patescibacteria group bacterium]